MFHSGNTNSEEDFELCMRVENVFLPQSGHFGVSAATGGLADDHDVLKFLTYSLHPPGMEPQSQQIADAEKERLAKEYKEYQEKLAKQQEEYYKQHPDEKKAEIKGDEDYDWGSQELGMILKGLRLFSLGINILF